MSLTLRTTFGCTEAVIDEDGGLKRFYEIADVLSDEFQVSYLNKQDDFDAIEWQFALNNNYLSLHYSIYNGTSIFPTHTANARKRENHAVVELANVLEGKLMNLDMRRKIA